MAMPIGVMYGLVTGMSEAITPAGFAYLTMPFSGISSMTPMLFWRSASRRMPSTFERRPASRLPMPLSSTLMLARRAADVSLPAAQPIAWQRRSTPAWSACAIACIAVFARRSMSWASVRSSGVIVRVAICSAGPRGSALLPLLPVVLNRNTITHRLLARVFLSYLGGESGDAADDEDELAGLGREAEIGEHRREAAVDVHRQRSHPLRNRRVNGAHEAHAFAFLLASTGQIG